MFQGKRNMAGPVVGIIGSTGYVGKCLLPTFLESVRDGRLKELRILASPEKLSSQLIQSYVSSGATVRVISSLNE